MIIQEFEQEGEFYTEVTRLSLILMSITEQESRGCHRALQLYTRKATVLQIKLLPRNQKRKKPQNYSWYVCASKPDHLNSFSAPQTYSNSSMPM